MNKKIDKLAWLNIENRKVLCARSIGKSTFYIPGGKRDLGESDVEALVREIKEELTVDLDTTTLSYYTTLEAQADGKPEGMMVKISCYRGKYTGTLAPDSEIEELSWLDFSDICKCSLVVKKLFEELYALNLIS
jgi:8-oxo-dGTP diphosphatase